MTPLHSPYKLEQMVRRSLIIVLLLAALGAGPESRAGVGNAQLMLPSSMAWYLAGFELGPWEAYLAGRLTPELDSVQRAEVPDISWLQIDQDIVLPDFARSLVGDSEPPGLSFMTSRLSRSFRFGGFPDSGPQSGTPGFQRSLLLSGITGQVDPFNSVSVSAVLASQQFSHSMMDLSEYTGGYRPVDFFAADRELSQGAGLQLGFASELMPRLMMNASFQSRINMDELASVRGVHGQSADLDIPSRVRMGLDMQTGQHTLFTFAVSQVFYSDVGAFPSRSLPARFNALLGDSSSPRFEWDDLTVYSVGMRWKHESDLEFKVDFHTRSQPSPTAPSLMAALEDDLAQHSLLVGLGKGIGKRTRLDLTASYAPPEFAFGGNVLGVVSERLDQAVEVAARLNVRF
ncbi:MAG: hypothetical protein KGY48_09600 [Wenzhouxiangellaceae bacterium]|nr:hypothetical protein [Wenzhouxiangellaceae bacterium]MBS3745918.1 hypothetical protein [Wenzhouxiangellaceae bacterium]MBS3822846.1 hypothetical protein [Wenzhouxiangellaceae bacterium]